MDKLVANATTGDVSTVPLTAAERKEVAAREKAALAEQEAEQQALDDRRALLDSAVFAQATPRERAALARLLGISEGT